MGYITKGNCGKSKATRKKSLIYLTLGVLSLAIAILTLVLDVISLISIYYARVDYAKFKEDYAKIKFRSIKILREKENRTNHDFVIDKEAGVMRYIPRHKVTFLPEESVGRPEDILVNMPNIAMLSMASAVSTYGYIAKMGFNLLARQFKSKATVQMSAYDYLWGYDEPLIKFGNKILPGWINFEILGLLDRLYDENVTMTMEVSAKDEDKFMIRNVNGIDGLTQWGYPESKSSCNSFNGSYEGLGYPPTLTSDRPIKIYRNVLCRFMELDYVGKKTSEFGVEGLLYKFSNKSYAKGPENECLCNKGICLEGVSDLSPCFYGLPVVMSNAHFLDESPSIYERVEGMSPNETEHGSEFLIEPVIGMVMTTRFSVQLNVMVRDVGFNREVSRFSDMIVPVLRLKIVQPKVPEDQVFNLRWIRVYGPYVLKALQIILILSSFFCLSHSGRLIYWNWISSRRNGVGFKNEQDIINAKNSIGLKDILTNEPLIISYDK